MRAMAALAYLLLPISGALAYFFSAHPRVRAHGLQAITFGLAWPLALYGGSAVSPATARAVWMGGAVIWLLLIVLTALKVDLVVPGLKRLAGAERPG